MPQISLRGQEMPASPIRKLVPYAEAAKKKGLTVYHLNIGQPDIETPPAMLQAVKNAEFKVLEYSHSAGNESYRRKLVTYYARNGIEVAHDQIIVTSGGSEAILFAFLACLDAGDEVITTEPFYANYHGFAVEANVTIKTIASSIETGFALPSVQKFEEAITPRTRAIIICHPNNPTGYLYTRDELQSLREIVLKHNLYLFSDEAYREFVYEGEHLSAMQLDGLEENVVLLDTISKRYSACGARIGALVSRNARVISTVLKFAQARLSPPGLAQILAEAAVDLPVNYFDGTREEYRSRRDLMVRRLNEMPGVFCPSPGGAFYAIARLPVDDSDKFCQWLLESFSYEGQTVMLAPASGFYGSEGLGKQEVRLAYVLNTGHLSLAMDCLEKALEEYGRR